MRGHIRPLVATHFRTPSNRPLPGKYDAARQLRLDQNALPIVTGGPIGETITFVRAEPADPPEPPMWLLETATKVVAEEPDDHLAMMETETRMKPDPADLNRGSTVFLPADDSVTGIVAF